MLTKIDVLLGQNGFTTLKKFCVVGTKKDCVVVFTTRLLQSQEYTYYDAIMLYSQSKISMETIFRAVLSLIKLRKPVPF